MNLYVSMLRGINVSGKHVIKMEQLRKLYEDLGFKEVRSYIQSGNLCFGSTEKDGKRLSEEISKKIKSEYHFDVPCIVLEADTLLQIINENPFMSQLELDSTYMHITFKGEPSVLTDWSKIESKASSNELFWITEKAVYLYCPNGYGSTQLNNHFLEKTLKVNCTTRNWKTVNALAQMMKETKSQR